MNFCDFCECDRCKTGIMSTHDLRAEGLNVEDIKLQHAPTDDGKWICDVCYMYDQCTSNINAGNAPRSTSGPCEDYNCVHRPKLIGGWSYE